MDNMETSTQPEVDVTQTAQPEAEAQADVQGTQTGVENTENQPKFKVKYNKEEKELTIDEAREFAEKGMNYDKVLSQRDEYKTKNDQYENSDEIKLWQELAKEKGMTVKEFINSFKTSRLAKKAQEQGISVEKLKQQQAEAADRAKKDERLAALEQFESDTLAQQEAERAAKEEVAAFKEAHPDVTLDQSVIDDWNAGVPLVKAFNFYEQSKEITELQKQLGIETANAENAEASTGKLGGGAEHETELTDELIAGMNKSEIDANWDRIDAKLFGVKKE